MGCTFGVVVFDVRVVRDCGVRWLNVECSRDRGMCWFLSRV